MPSNDETANEETNEIEIKSQNLRKEFLKDYESSPQLYDECDVDRVRESDWTLKRFLLSNKLNEELALKNLTDTMKWRKSFGVNTRTDDYFPDDFFKIGGLFEYKNDKNGIPLLYIRVSVHHKVTELSQLVKEYFVHKVNRIDTSSAGNWAIVFDSSNSGLSNVDMEFSRFIIHVLQTHFPKGYKYVLIYEMPWVMVAAWNISKTWISDSVKQLIRFSDSQQIFDFIDAHNLPKHMGGSCETSIYAVPEGVKPAEQLPHLNFTEEQINQFRITFNIKANDSELNEHSLQENGN